MKSLRSFGPLVVFYVFSLLSGSSAAQTVAHGKFTLPHEVHWQSALVPPGDYEFFVKRSGGGEFLILERAGGNSTGLFLMIPASRPASSTAVDKLLVVHRGDQRFVSSLELPQYDLGLDFSVPTDTVDSAKPLAQAQAVPSPQSE